MSDRRAEIAANLVEFRERVALSCAAAGRSPEQVSLVAVTKTFPADDVRLLAELGITDVGENRDQEAAPKAAACAGLDLQWHFVGALQRNKCRSVATYADVVQSVDRLALVPALSKAAVAAGRSLTALLQVSLDPPDAHEGRSGVAPGEIEPLATAVEAAPGLELAGVMAVAPQGGDPEPAFAALAEIATRLRAGFPNATAVSAGMSGDFDVAIRYGATHLRVGTALLGTRSSLVG